jgi:signal transduction histidine kinase
MEQTSPGYGREGSRPRVVARSAVAPTSHASNAPPELRAVIDPMPEAVVVIDREDRVRVVNPAADRLFAGRPVQNEDDLLSRFEALGPETPGDEPITLRPRGVPHRWFELRSFPIGKPVSQDAREDDSGGRIFVLRDVTSARAERAERHAFLAILSHELRTPITTIYAGSRVLARRGTNPRTSTEIAADINAEAARLYDIVEDLLVLTRAEQGMLELSREPILLQRIAESVIRVAKVRWADLAIIQAGAADPPAVAGDAGYVEQVVRNLVTAAVRYATPGSPVVVRLDQDDAGVNVRIQDRGPELTDDEIEGIFDVTEAPPSPRRAGAGIAPFVCRRLIETMGGRIWAARRPEGGTEFGFHLPRFEELD